MSDHYVDGVDTHLSIGEVLALLLEEFPDITISKIRFLESQGLIAPERTASGYRKFRDPDVDLLRCILREQRENFLPLRVIKDRIESGAIDPTGELQRPRGIRNVVGPDDTPPALPAVESSALRGLDALFPPSSSESRDGHPASWHPAKAGAAEPVASPADASPSRGVPPTLLPGVLLSGPELCSAAGITSTELADLRQYGVINSHRSADDLYDDEALEIASIARRLLRQGIDARHLRGWKVSAEREAGLFEQLIQPLIRQRNPESRAHANEMLRDLDEAGGRLRAALMRSALDRFITP